MLIQSLSPNISANANSTLLLFKNKQWNSMENFLITVSFHYQFTEDTWGCSVYIDSNSLPFKILFKKHTEYYKEHNLGN